LHGLRVDDAVAGTREGSRAEYWAIADALTTPTPASLGRVTAHRIIGALIAQAPARAGP
jgi:hypothetical protein